MMKHLPIKCQNIIAEAAEISGYLWEKGWAEQNGGNFSIDVSGIVPADLINESASEVLFPVSQPELAGRSFLVKIAGARMREVARQPEKHVLLIHIHTDLRGYSILWGGDRDSRPTSEFISHLKIHQFLQQQQRSEKVFLHTHPMHLIALSQIREYCQEEQMNRILFSMHPEVSIYVPDGIGLAPYRCPGSPELADVTVLALAHHRAVLWEKHGCAAIGNSLSEAFDLIDILEKAAHLFFICQTSGFHPEGLSRNCLEEISRKYGSRI